MNGTKCISLVLFTTAVFLSAHGAEPPAKRDREIANQLRAFMDGLVSENKFSGAVLLAKREEILFEGAYGNSDGTKNTIESEFALASVTKVFTAVAILQSAQAGKFSLDDGLIAVLPSYPNKETAGKITIRHLLNHQAGLANLFQKFASVDFEKSPKAESFLALFANDPLLFEPGTKTSYSNGGPLILGLVVERASGRTYEEYVADKIFLPAGMKNTRFLTGQTRGLNSIGGAVSNVRDLLRFSNALQNHNLLKKEYADLMMAGGAGMELRTVNDVTMVGHIGGAPGVSTCLDIYPKLGFTLVALSTTDGAAIVVRDWLRENLTRR
jgi:D-alanyl-D-alanine carboxypeptidase